MIGHDPHLAPTCLQQAGNTLCDLVKHAVHMECELPASHMAFLIDVADLDGAMTGRT